MEGKRGAEEDAHELALTTAKRPRREQDVNVLAVAQEAGSRALAGLAAGSVPRTSSLDAPTMLLTGHSDAVYSVKFAPNGAHLASASRDKTVSLWNVRGDCQNYMVLHGHKNAVLEVQWTADGSQLLSCSADKTVRAWDAETGQSVKKMGEHTGIVNSVCAARRGPPLLVSGSDDGTARLWDLRVRRCVQKFGEVPGSFPVTCVALGAGSETLFAGGVDNLLRAWDLRTGQLSLTLEGHGDTVTGCSLSPDGSFLLSNAMDNTLRVWDVRPFAPSQRCVKVLTAHAHNFEKLLLRCSWSADGSKVSCGSADRMLYVWGADGALQYKLPGHKGSVNEAVFHPQEPIVASCSSDQTIYLGELAA